MEKQAEDASLAREQSKRRALEVERERVVELQRRQREQEQFSAFEELIRRQELEKERQRVVQEFGTPGTPPPEGALLSGIQGPPPAYSTVSPATPPPESHSDLPGSANNHNPYNAPPAYTPGTTTPSAPPTFDRSLKPGSLASPDNNCELIFF